MIKKKTTQPNFSDVILCRKLYEIKYKKLHEIFHIYYTTNLSSKFWVKSEPPGRKFMAPSPDGIIL